MAEISDAELKELLANSREMKAELDLLKEDNKNLRGLMADNAGPRILKKVTERKVRLRIVDGKAVVGYKNRGTDGKPLYIVEKVDPNDKNSRLLFVTLILEDKTELEVDYNEFLRETTSVEALVKETVEKEWTIEQGTVRQKMVEEYSMIETDVVVPVEIVGKIRTFKVAVPETSPEFKERELTIHENYVNI